MMATNPTERILSALQVTEQQMNMLLQGVDYLLEGNEPVPCSIHHSSEIEQYQLASHEIDVALVRLRIQVAEVNATILPELQLRLSNYLDQLTASAKTLKDRIAELPKTVEMRVNVRAMLEQLRLCEEHQLLSMRNRVIALLREPKMPHKLSMELFNAKAGIDGRLKHASLVAAPSQNVFTYIPHPKPRDFESSKRGA